MKRFAALLLLLFIVFGCLPSGTGPAPDFSVESLSKPGTLATKEGLKGKVVLLDFWATWCGPCHEMAPELERVYQEYKDKGFEIVSISSEDRATVEAFAKKREETYPIYLDTTEAAEEAYDIRAFPTLHLLDKDGNYLLKDAYDVEAVERALKRTL